MVIDSISTKRSKNRKNSDNSRKKPGISKGVSNPVSDSAKAGSASLRRSTRGTNSREQITSTSSATETPPGKELSAIPSNTRKSERFDKKDTSPPVKRKLEVLEKEKLSSSPLRRSDRGKKQLLSASPDSSKYGKVTALPDVNRKKLRREKSIKQFALEAIKTTEVSEEVERHNGQIIKRINGRTFKGMFRQQRRRDPVPNLEKELENPEKLSQDDRSYIGVSVRTAMEDGEDGVENYSKKIGEECAEKDCEGGNEQSVSKNGFRDTPSEPSYLNVPNSFRGSTTREEILNGIMTGEGLIDDSERLQAGHGLVVELHCPEGEILRASNVVEGTDIVPSSSSKCDKDKFVAPCGQCCKSQRLGYNSLVQELCSCDKATESDLKQTFTSEGRVELAPCDDLLTDTVNDGNVNMYAMGKLDGKLTLDSSKFIEYWVPVSTSNVQLEQYCATLLQNSTTLRSSSFKDIVGGALHDILISTKKCCDHPYFVDSKLQGLLTKDVPPVEYLDVGIKASGKLQLLDTVLPEIKRQGKRVVILYQSIRSAGLLTGDVLDDFLRQRFGLDSYERIDKGIKESKKQAALNKFNSKDSGRFVFLLEKHACSPTIRLSSVDAVLIFDSDWNLMNDNRALRKLSIDSSPEPIKIFRFYTSCTLEEKVLDLATNQVPLDSNHISRTTSHMLLMWGASYIFSKLDGFHSSNPSKGGASLCSETSLLKDVAGEFMDLLIQNAESSCRSSLITKVQVTRETYSKNAPLFGELKVQSTDGKEPHLFWNELLECKNPSWKFLSGYSQRNRKRVPHFGDLPEKPDAGPDDVRKKQKKIASNSADVASLRTRRREEGSGVVSPKSIACVLFPPNHISSASEVPKADLEEGTELHDVQKHFLGHLKSSILELSETLQLPENAKTLGESFLEYIVKNHQTHSESSTIQQALQISLIWIAASLLQHKVDKKKDLDVARKLLGFRCTDLEVSTVHSKLRGLKEKFKEMSHTYMEVGPTKDFSDDRLKQILKKCKKRKTKLDRRHEEEIQEFNRFWEEKRANIENQHRIESAVVRNIYHSHQAVRLESLKRVDEGFAKKMDEHNCERELRLQELKGKHLDECEEEDQKAKSWLQEITSPGPSERPITFAERVGPSESKFHDGRELVGAITGESQSPNRTDMTEVATTMPMITAREKMGCDVTFENPSVPSQSLCSRDTTGHLGNLSCSNDASAKTAVCDLPYTEEQISDDAPCAQETDVTAPNEFAGDDKSLEASDYNQEFDKVDNERADINTPDPDFVENCNDADVSFRQWITMTADRGKPSESCGVTVEIQNLGSEQSLFGTDPEKAPSGSCETAPNDFAGGAKSLGTSNPDGEYNKENSKSNSTNLPVTASVEDIHNMSVNTRSDDNVRTELPLVTSPAVQILETRAQDVLSSQNNAPQDECPRQSTSAGILRGDTTGCENTINIMKQAETRQAELSAASVALHNGDTCADESYNVTDLIEGSPPLAPPDSEQTEHHLPHVEPSPYLDGEQSIIESGENRLPSLVTQIVDEVLNDENAPPSAPPGFELADHHLPHAEQPPSLNRELSTMESGENRLPSLAAQFVDEVLNDDGAPPSAPPGLKLTEHHLPHAELPRSLNGEKSPMESEENRLPPFATQIVDEVPNHDGSLMGIPPPTDTPVVGVRPHPPSRHPQQMNSRAQPRPLLSDPLQIELERLHKETEEANRSLEDSKLQLKSEYEKEKEELLRRYEAKLKGVEAEHLLKKKGLDANHNKVFMNRILAEAFRTKCLEFKSSASPGMYQAQSTNFLHQLLTLSRHPQRKSSGSGSPNIIPPAATQQTAVPSVPAVPRLSPSITSIPMRQHRPLINTQHPIGNFPVSGTIRATAPHLRPSLPNQGLPAQDPQRRSPFPAVSQVPPRLLTPLPPQQPLMQPPCQPIHHVENSSAARPPNVLPHGPDLGTNFVELYLSQGGVQGGDRVNGGVNLARSSVMSDVDVVYLSDDE